MIYRGVVLSLLSAVGCAQNRNYDRFNYGASVREGEKLEFGPRDWGHVQCLNKSSCLGFPDAWEYANGWEFDQNHCRWCPDGIDCGVHHQSPIALDRNVIDNTTTLHNPCIDVHWMQYHDSTCTFDHLREKRAFQIDRHALKIIQPITMNDRTGRFHLDCRTHDGIRWHRRWGRIDFSRGYSAWWHLSHVDFHVPSEHTQNGKRYDAELQMYHFYSKTGEEAGIDNEMASVTVFLEAYNDAPDLDVLNRLICAWREEEELTRKRCPGLESVKTEYPMCDRYGRANARRTKSAETPLSTHDILIANHMGYSQNATFVPKLVQLEEDDLEMDLENLTAHDRDLLNAGRTDSWSNYFAMLAVRTEYYYRYSGTQTVPPCYGKWFPKNNRRQTNHWRVMKDPIRVSHRQIKEMHRLLRERIAPHDDPVSPCKSDTAARVDESSGRVSTARPLQSNHKAHYQVFCECDNWKSKWQEDKEWCLKDKHDRLFNHPYNFPTNGF